MRKSRRIIQSTLANKLNNPEAITGVMGNGFGHVQVRDRQNYCYVRIAGKVEEVYNIRVAPTNDLAVLVGRDPNMPDLFQILSVRPTTSGIAETTPDSTNRGKYNIFPHHKTHEWMARGGGNDVVYSQLRQFLPLRLSPVDALLLGVYPGVVWSKDGYKLITGTILADAPNFDMATGTERWLLTTIDDNANVVYTTGSSKLIGKLDFTDIPSFPTGTRYVLGAVREYRGQSKFYEAKDYTDILDLRFPMHHFHSNTDILSGSFAHIIQYNGANLPNRTFLNFIGANVIVTDDSANNATRVFITGSISPIHVKRDDVLVGTRSTLNFLYGTGIYWNIIDDGNEIDIRAHSIPSKQLKLVYVYEYNFTENINWYFDGVLATGTNMGAEIYPGFSGQIMSSVMSVKYSGLTGTTTVDINKNGSSIFGSAPGITADSARKVITPTVVTGSFIDSDYYNIDIDSVAEDASSLSVNLALGKQEPILITDNDGVIIYAEVL